MTPQVWTFDVETKMTEEHQSVERIICFSYYDGKKPGIVARDYGAYDIIKWLLTNDEVLLVNQNINFDLGCVIHTWPDLFPLIIEKYEKLLFDDVMYRERLYAIARGYYQEKYKRKGYFSLKQIVDRRFGIQVEKGGVQLQYHLVDDLPIERYPKEYIDYSLDDSIHPYNVYFDQNHSMLRYFQIDEVPDSKEQTRAHFGLFLMGKMIGIRTDPKAIQKVEKTFTEELISYEPALRHWGILRPKGTVNKKRLQQIVEFAYTSQGLKIPKTDPSKTFPKTESNPQGGQTATGKDILEDINYPILEIKKQHKKCEYYLSNYVKMLKTGIDIPIFVYYQLLDTGRTSASPNVQNQSRKYGIRECYIPSNPNGDNENFKGTNKEWVFLDADYSALEMCTFAQCIYWIVGPNKLMDALNNEMDPHIELCRRFPQFSLSYKQILAIKSGKTHPLYEAIYGASGGRLVSKIGNFGYAGGMGPLAFVDYAKSNSEGLIILTLEESAIIKESWFEAWPEARPYFRVMGKITDDHDPVIEQFISKRLRGGLTFTKCSNGFFSALAADGAKNALWLITKACFYDKKSPLFGCWPNAFIHDQNILSCPIDRAPEAGEELSRLMVEGMQPYTPDVKIKTSIALTDRWYKSAEETRDQNGRLTVYRGEA